MGKVGQLPLQLFPSLLPLIFFAHTDISQFKIKNGHFWQDSTRATYKRQLEYCLHIKLKTIEKRRG